jgi:hypothetical protein
LAYKCINIIFQVVLHYCENELKFVHLMLINHFYIFDLKMIVRSFENIHQGQQMDTHRPMSNKDTPLSFLTIAAHLGQHLLKLLRTFKDHFKLNVIHEQASL